MSKIEWDMVFFLIGLQTVIGLVEKVGILEIVVKPLDHIFSLNIMGGLILVQWTIALA